MFISLPKKVSPTLFLALFIGLTNATPTLYAIKSTPTQMAHKTQAALQKSGKKELNALQKEWAKYTKAANPTKRIRKRDIFNDLIHGKFKSASKKVARKVLSKADKELQEDSDQQNAQQLAYSLQPQSPANNAQVTPNPTHTDLTAPLEKSPQQNVPPAAPSTQEPVTAPPLSSDSEQNDAAHPAQPAPQVEAQQNTAPDPQHNVLPAAPSTQEPVNPPPLSSYIEQNNAAHPAQSALQSQLHTQNEEPTRQPAS